MCSDLGSGSRCCAFYSATGFIFTVRSVGLPKFILLREPEFRLSYSLVIATAVKCCCLIMLFTFISRNMTLIPTHKPGVCLQIIFVLSSQLFVAVLITTQPFYLAGIEDVEKAQGSAYGATGMFLFTFLASIGGIWFDSMQKIEPAANGTESEAGYHLSHDIPSSYGTSA